MIKKVVVFFIIAMMVFGMIASVWAEENSDSIFFENINYNKTTYIRVFVEGKELSFDVKPQSINSRVMVPLGVIFEEFGLNVQWNQAQKTITASNSDINIVFKLGSKTAIINSVEQMMDAPAMAVNGKTMIPLRFLSQSMGYNIVWNSSSNIILLSKKNIIEWRYGGYETVPPYKEFEIKYYNGYKTEEIRYTGKNHDVKFYSLYTSNGKLIQGIPEFNLNNYGKGWMKTSIFSNKTYWIDYRLLESASGSILYDEGKGTFLNLEDMLKTSESGNYIKLSISEQYIDLDLWKKLVNTKDSEYSTLSKTKDLDGKIIMGEDTLFKVTVNDKFNAVVSAKPILNAISSIEKDKYNGALLKNPKTLFNWSDSDWERLKGNVPWVGMKSDMLVIQKMRNPDQVAKIKTKFSNIELWVYEEGYVDSVFYIKDGILLSIL